MIRETKIIVTSKIKEITQPEERDSSCGAARTPNTTEPREPTNTNRERNIKICCIV